MITVENDCGCVGVCRAAAKADWAKPSGCHSLRPATSLFCAGDPELRAYKAMLTALWPQLSWRHAGFGALQAYIREGDDAELRVHVWHPALVKPGIADSGLCHDHRFDMRSTVLVGEIVNRECTLHQEPDGDWETWEVLHARAAKEKMGETFHQDPTQTGVRYRREVTDYRVSAGAGYTFRKRAFHESHVDRLTVTLVEKLNQEAFNARILAPHGRDIVHAFSTPLPSDGEVVSAVLREALVSLGTGVQKAQS